MTPSSFRNTHVIVRARFATRFVQVVALAVVLAGSSSPALRQPAGDLGAAPLERTAAGVERLFVRRLPLDRLDAQSLRAQPIAAGPISELDATTAAAFGSALDSARSQFGVYGVAFAVADAHGIRWTGASGTLRDTRTPLATDTPQVIGSVTKTFVATLVLELAQEGRISLDDQVTLHLPEATVARGVTIRQLLSHTSGIADLFSAEMNALVDSDPERVWTPEQVLATIGDAWFEPGKDWAYSNTNYLLLDMLVERLSGSTLDEEIARRFGGPLDLPHTHTITSAEAAKGLLQPSLATTFAGSGSMVSTPAELARWGEALYGGDLLDDAMLASMLAFNDDNYGLGTQRVEVEKGLSGPGHSGLLGTSTTLLVHLPKQDVTLAIIANFSRADLVGMLTHRSAGRPSLLDLALGRTPLPATH